MTKITNQDNVCTVQLANTAKQDHYLTESAQSVDAMVPGSKFLLKTKRVLRNGLEVTFNGENIGYVNQIHLKNKKLAHYFEDQEIEGTLMYVLPMLKFAYFSEIVGQEPAHFERGDIVQTAKVIGFEFNCVYFRLNKSARALVPFTKTDVNYDQIRDAYKPDVEYPCRVLSYEPLDQVYICSTQKSILNQKYMTVKDFKFGEVVKVKVVRIHPDGALKVMCERFVGFVLNNHVYDPPMKKMPKLGSEVVARVLTMKRDERGILFTLRPSLVNSTLPPLTSVEKAKVSSVHAGLVTYCHAEQGIFVRFYNEVTGLLKYPEEKHLREKLRLQIRGGNVYNFVVKKVKDEKLYLKLGIWKNLVVEEICRFLEQFLLL